MLITYQVVHVWKVATSLRHQARKVHAAHRIQASILFIIILISPS